MTDDVVIRVEGLWKRYGMPPLRGTLRDFLKRRGGGGSALLDGPWALTDVHFDLREGETLGVIGPNGAGKSTLLKVLAGVSPATRGVIDVRGRIFPMLELSAGLHPDLTGWENIRLLGVVMGLTRREIAEKQPDIGEFCELGDWLDQPVKTYSTGMLARLGFAVAVHMDADVLIVDEVMSVGDLNFRNKCMRKLEEFRSGKSGIVFSSHSMHEIQRICDRAMFIDAGRVVHLGTPGDVVERYESFMREHRVEVKATASGFDFVGATLENARMEDRDGTPLTRLEPGIDATLSFTFHFSKPLDVVTVNVVVESMDNLPVVWNTLDIDRLGEGRHGFRLEWSDMRLKAGAYTIRIGLAVGGFTVKGFREVNAVQFEMTGDILNRGIYLPQSAFHHLGASAP